MKTLNMPIHVACYRLIVFAAIASVICLPVITNAQGSITNVYTHTANATTSTTYSGTDATGNAASGVTSGTYTYKFGLNVATTNNVTILDSLTAYSINYHYLATTFFVKFRRVNNSSVTGLRKSMRVEQTGGTVAVGGTVSCYPDYNDSLEQVYAQRIFNIGIDNVFQNATTTNNINIERMDVVFPLGVKATDNTKAGFAVFDWGTAGGHDPFYIAAIKTLDASGNPSSYYAPVLVAAGNYGSGVGGNSTYVIMRKNPTDSKLLLMNNSTTQNRDGILFRFKELSVASNTYIYGYSLFGPDVVVSPVTNLVDYTNATNFPTTTDLSGGGLDPLAVTGLWVNNNTNVVLADRVDDLHAAIVNDQVKLSWDLQTASDLKEQVIERSIDGINYSAIIHMPVQGTGAQTALDTRPENGTDYYRLKLVQQDGSTAAYSSVSRVDVKAYAPVIEVYPNPVKNKLLNLDIRGLSNGAYSLLLLDMNGRPVFRQFIAGDQAIKTSLHLPGNLAIGTYVLKLTDNAGNKVLERQIVVE